MIEAEERDSDVGVVYLVLQLKFYYFFFIFFKYSLELFSSSCCQGHVPHGFYEDEMRNFFAQFGNGFAQETI